MTTSATPRTALVTGGTSGIGLAVVKTLAARGLRVFLCARSRENVDAVVKELRDQGLQVAGCEGDVRSRESVERVVRAAVDRFGPLSVLVNNAGRSGGGVTARIPDELWYDVIDTNLNSAFLVTREALTTGGLERAGVDGRIISIASTGGKQGVPLGAPYSASKAGLIGFTKALAKELAPTGVTVNAVCPGYVETPMAVRVRQAYAATWDTTEEDVLSRFNDKIPLGRYSTPEEVAALVGHLAGDEAGSITAQALNVCGGLGIYCPARHSPAPAAPHTREEPTTHARTHIPPRRAPHGDRRPGRPGVRPDQGRRRVAPALHPDRPRRARGARRPQRAAADLGHRQRRGQALDVAPRPGPRRAERPVPAGGVFASGGRDER